MDELGGNPPQRHDARPHRRKRVAVVRTDPLAVVVLLVFTLLLGLGIAFVLTHFDGSRQAAEAVLPDPSLLETPATKQAQGSAEDHIRSHEFARWNFTAALPNTWKNLRGVLNTPQEVTEIEYTFVKDGTSCALVYAQFPKLTLNNEYPQTTIARTVKREDTFVGTIERRIAPAYGTTSPVRASDSSFEPYEIALAYQPLYYDNGTGDTTRNTWILFSSNNTPVTNDCYEDFTDLIRSVSPHFEQHTLTKRSEGLLYIEEHDTGTQLLFRDADDDTARIVTLLDTGAVYKPTLVDHELYYIGTNGSLYRCDLVTGEIDVVIDPTQDEASVNDFRVIGTDIYYLEGAWCNTHNAPCDLALNRLNTNTTTSTLLHTGITDRIILGLDSDNQMLLLAYTENNPTYTWGTVHTYDHTTDTYEEVYDYEVNTEDDEVFATHETTLETLLEDIPETHKNVTSLTTHRNTYSRGPDQFEGVVTKRIPILFIESE